MSDCRLTTFDNPYDPFEQFTLWWLFDNEKGYNTCGKLDRISHFTDDMSDKEIDEEHERAVDEIIDNDFLNIICLQKQENQGIMLLYLEITYMQIQFIHIIMPIMHILKKN